jgi:hypothetical protein
LLGLGLFLSEQGLGREDDQQYRANPPPHMESFRSPLGIERAILERGGIGDNVMKGREGRAAIMSQPAGCA